VLRATTLDGLSETAGKVIAAMQFDGSGSNQDERFPPPRPERSQHNPEQLAQISQSSARPLRSKSEQLPTESQVFEDEVLAGAKRADDPPKEIPERHKHGKNIIGTI
jgi:hypothetical protein